MRLSLPQGAPFAPATRPNPAQTTPPTAARSPGPKLRLGSDQRRDVANDVVPDTSWWRSETGAIIEAARVKTRAIDRVAYASNASHYLLTPRAVLVVANTTEMAAALHVSEGTIKAHLGSIMQKWNVRDRVQVLITAARAGLVDFT